MIKNAANNIEAAAPPSVTGSNVSGYSSTNPPNKIANPMPELSLTKNVPSAQTKAADPTYQPSPRDSPTIRSVTATTSKSNSNHSAHSSNTP